MYSSSSRRTALFFSGAGSTAQALLDQAEILNIVSVFSSKKSAAGLIRAKRAGLMAHICQFPQDNDLVLNRLNQTAIDCIFLVGFMKILPSEFINQFKSGYPNRRIFNIHPSLLPRYKGLLATEMAYADQSALGVTIHDVIPEVDSGKWFKRTLSLTGSQIQKIQLSEARLWQRACEQNSLKTWGSCHQ